MRVSSRLLELGALGLCLLSAAEASAYCRTTNAELTREELLSNECVTRGEQLFWRERNLSYAFSAELASRDLGTETVRAMFEQAFAQWGNVDCDAVPFRVKDSGRAATERTAQYVRGADNLNAVMFQSAERWNELGHDSNAYALTILAYEPTTGEILGADIEINEGRGPYGLCPELGCEPFSGTTDLPNVLTHEAGHFLGLSHSDQVDSTMFFRADPWETHKRSLEGDDVNGLCEILQDERAEEENPSAGGSDGCSLGSARKNSFSALWLVGLCLVTRRSLRRGAQRILAREKSRIST